MLKTWREAASLKTWREAASLILTAHKPRPATNTIKQVENKENKYQSQK